MSRRDIRTDPVIITGCGHSGSRGLIAALSHTDVYLGATVNETHEWEFYRILAARVNAWLLDIPERHDHNWIPPDVFRSLQIPGTKIAELRSRIVEQIVAHEEESLPPGSAEVWCIKTPRMALCLDVWRAVFPDSRILHLVRDGRDVAVSTRWSSPAGPLERRFELWRSIVDRMWRYRLAGEPIRDLRYEDLTDATIVAAACSAVGLPFAPAMLRAIELTAGRGIDAMKFKHYERIELIRYGYAPGIPVD